MPAAALWARSGAMALTTTSDGRPTTTGAGSAAILAEALRRTAELTTERTGTTVRLPGVELLGERAAITGSRRDPGGTVGGAGRSLRAADGWWFLSMPRPADRELVPALIERTRPEPEEWEAVARWSASRSTTEAVDRARLLGLAAAVIPPTAAAADNVHLRHREGRAVIETMGGTRRADVQQPLVVDLSALWAGPLAAHLIGLGGARVVKIESPHRLDGARRGPAAFYDLLHSGHDSVTVDLTTPNGRRDLVDLLRTADVVIESSRPRAMSQLGIDVKSLVDDGVIWASITAYGRTGPWQHRIGFGDDVAAAAGLVARLDGVPVPVGDAIGDPIAGAVAAAAIAAALREDRGRVLDISMRDAAREAADRRVEAAILSRNPRGGWHLRCEGHTYPVAEPAARQPHAPAAAAGAHNDGYLDVRR